MNDNDDEFGITREETLEEMDKRNELIKELKKKLKELPFDEITPELCPKRFNQWINVVQKGSLPGKSF